MNPEVITRFWSNVDVRGSDECWPWTAGTQDKMGYGTFKHRPIRVYLAHVFALVLATGELPNGRNALHSCDNPPCCNSVHLRWGTREDNTRDMVERGRSTRGEKSVTAKLTEDQVLEIRCRWAAGENHTPLAREFGVKRTTIAHVIKGSTWAHLELPDGSGRPTFCAKGHELTAENTKVERTGKRSWKRCVICRIASLESYNALRRERRAAAKIAAAEAERVRGDAKEGSDA